ncbi:hypothetical protein FAS41_27855 [Pseudomonas nicosulfuronedens]|uniref:Uncharacterized protein n=1 Tax=Pseudomonas nicosulfuronedens TaxID=2571105 RepID=A0A5R9QMC2_9PSED|nr:hypothetical protein [Pseudomonas nicosulfuronedens]TLX70483.1 hypothetical protein FAS41_27855 [Pseudomonas nicosulfuronedens]
MRYENRTGRKPLAKARVIRALRALQTQGIPATLGTILKREPGLAKSSALQALAQLPSEANLQVRILAGTSSTRQYILATTAQHHGIKLDSDTIRAGARAENTLLILLGDWEAKR